MNIYRKQRRTFRQLGLALLALVLLGAGTAQAESPEPYLVKDILPGSYGSSPFPLIYVNGTFFFAGHDGVHGQELWKSDGTEEGTVMVKDINLTNYNSFMGSAVDLNGTLFFAINDGVHGMGLWKSDGTAEGTVQVKDIGPRFYNTYISRMANVNGLILCFVDDGIHGYELWKSDGTEAGTVLLKDITPGAESSRLGDLSIVGDTLFFTIVEHDYIATELWKSDGTEDGTVLVKEFINPYPGSNCTRVGDLTNVDGTLFFYADDGIHGSELWKSDGTEEGTVLFKDIVPGASGTFLSGLTNVNGTLFFVADNGVHGQELWKSDGTEAGTVLVKDIWPGPNDSYPKGLTNVNGTLFFNAEDDVHSAELWKSDGTEAGTVLVKDIKPGPGYSYPNFLSNVDGRLFFTADDGHGGELWMSDGTEEGTVRLTDINPGPAYSNIWRVIKVNDLYFFAADDGVHGRELWARKASPDLTFSKKVVDSGTPLFPGDVISYTLTYRNFGDATASGVVINDSLPDGLTQFNVSSSGATITRTPGVTYTWQVEDLEPGEGGVISITAMIDPAFAGGMLTSAATISSTTAEISDDNNDSVATVVVQPRALRVFKSVQGPGGVLTGLQPNDVVTYSIRLENSLNELAAGVVLTDPLPLDVRFGGWVQQGSAQLPPPSGTGTLATEIIRWGPWGIPAGEEVSIVFTATVAPGSAWLDNPVVNTAWFSSTNAGSGSASAAFIIKPTDIFLPLLIKP